MRAFIVLALVAAASAGLLPTPGYDYGVGHSTGQIFSNNAYGNALLPVSSGSSYGNIGSVGTGGSLVGGGSYGNIGSVGTGGSLVGGGSYGDIGSVGTGGSLVGGGSYGTSGSFNAGQVGGTTVVGLSALDSVPQTVEYSKQFYHFTAPEEEHHHGHTEQKLSNVLKKNLQVVFIKAPENNAATNAALQLAKQAIEQKTAIYVLSKENDASQVIGQLQQIQENVQTSPEVRFIKYRTPQDIAVAKQTIQSQYDNFGGASQNFDGGVAPVLNYASKVANTNYNAGGSLLTGGVTGGVTGGTISYSNGGSAGGNLFGSGSSVSNVHSNYLPANPLR